MREEKIEELEKIIDSLKTIKKEKLTKEPRFIKSEVYRCHLNNDKTITREKILKNNRDGSAAIILPVTSDNNVVLTVEPRVFSKRTVGIGVPAGYIEDGEDSYVAALRELEEETGLVPDKLTKMGGFYQDMGCSSAYNETFLATGCKWLKNQNLDESEYIKYFECTYDEALELVDMNYIEGCNAVITLNKAKKYIKKGK
mgnify:FL=1